MDPQGKPPSETDIHRDRSNSPDSIDSSSNLDDYDLSAPVIEERRGSLPGNVRVRIVRSEPSGFRRVHKGVLEATEAVYVPRGFFGRFGYQVKRALVGEPIA